MIPYDQLESHPQSRGQVQDEKKDREWREGALGTRGLTRTLSGGRVL